MSENENTSLGPVLLHPKDSLPVLREAQGCPSGIGAEIVITDAMIEVGLQEYALFDSEEPGMWVICAVYRAMALAACQSKSPAPAAAMPPV